MKTHCDQSDGGAAAGNAAVGLLAPSPLTLASGRGRLADYAELTKVRITSLVLVAAAVGYGLGVAGPLNVAGLIHTLVGTFLTAAGASILNQFMERRVDALMVRTADRPLPAGRISPAEALAVGTAACLLGSLYLLVWVNAWSSILAALTIGLYLFAYTPLKRRTVANTWIGAVAGAMPPLIGFAGARGELATPAWLLFALLFVWQLPHFFAIAWMYRDDYVRARYRMLSVVDPTGAATGRQTLGLSLVLLVVSLLPSTLGYAGALYFAGAVICGLALLTAAARLATTRSYASARLVLLVSVIYLPAVMMLLLLDRRG